MAEESVSSRRASTRAKKAEGQASPAVKVGRRNGGSLEKVNGCGKREPVDGLGSLEKVNGRGKQEPKTADEDKEVKDEVQAASATAESRKLWRVKAMLVLYTSLLLMGFGLSLASDLSRLVPTLLKLSLALQVVATIFFVLVVPLTHASGSYYHQKWKFFQPFRGGVRFILFQTLSWTFYALCLVLAMSCLLFWSYLAKFTFGVVTSFGVMGVLSQVFMVSSLFVYERNKMHRSQSFDGSSSTISSATVAGANRLVNSVSKFLQTLFFHHNIVLAIVAVALAVVAEFCWITREVGHHLEFSRVAGSLSVLLFTTVVFNTYGVGGRMAHGSTKKWRFYQPFLGGAKFVLLQALSWSFFTISVIVEVAFIISTFALGFELFVGAAVVAGLFFIVSEVLMIVSLSFFLPTESTEGKRSVVSFIPMTVDEDSLEQFRRLTVITVLSNMQYIPFLFPIVPFLFTGLSLSDAAVHWFGFFLCLASGVVVNAYVKQMSAKYSRSDVPEKKSSSSRAVSAAKALPRLFHLLPAVFTVKAWHGQAWGAWLFLTTMYYLYIYLTFGGQPEVTGRRYLGQDLKLFGFSLYTLLDGVDRYFNGRIIAVEPLRKDRHYVFAFHPHGVQPFTVMWIQLSKPWREGFKGMRFSVMTASVMHFVPVMRDILQWLGGREVSKESILNALGKKESILLVPGGQQEMMESQSKTEEIRIITKHVGFIRVAMQSGTPLVPVLSFGEVEVMDFVRLPSLQRFFISRIGIPVPFFPYGLLGFPIPRPVPCTVIFGKPIPVKKDENPSAEAVKKVAAVYFKAIEEMFDKYKVEGNAPNHKLILI